MKVKDIMSHQVLTLHPKEKIRNAYDLCNLHKIHHLPITVHNKVVGILSYGDLLFARDINSKLQIISKDEIQTLGFDLVESIMKRNPITIDKDAEVTDAVDLMVKFRINCLPVVDDGLLVGIFTSFDVMRYVQQTD